MIQLQPITDHEQQIQAARAILKPSPVRLNKVPPWMRRRLLTARRQRGLDTYSSNSIDVLFQLASARVVDHFGTIDYRGRTAFVSEPYALDIPAIQEFVGMLGPGVRWDVEANSWHFPGQTFRIVFWEESQQ